jgi:hypothetical protein
MQSSRLFPVKECSKDHAKLTTRDVSYDGCNLWRCLECARTVHGSALVGAA